MRPGDDGSASLALDVRLHSTIVGVGRSVVMNSCHVMPLSCLSGWPALDAAFHAQDLAGGECGYFGGEDGDGGRNVERIALPIVLAASALAY